MTTVPRIWKSSSGPEFSRKFRLTVDDHLAVSLTSQDYLKVWPYALGIGFWVLMCSLIVTHEYWLGGQHGAFLLYNGLAMLGSYAVAWFLARPVGRRVREYFEGKLEKADQLGDELETTVNKAGFTIVWRGLTTHIPWDAIVAVEEDAGTFYFWATKEVGYVWPVRLFENEPEQEAFRASVTDWLGRPITPPVLVRLGDEGRHNIDLRKIGY